MLLTGKLLLGVGFVATTTVITFLGNAATKATPGEQSSKAAAMAAIAASGIEVLSSYSAATYAASGACPGPCDWASAFSGK